jgi:D,D-heptose 1,7-bisphosphate phosphatase
LGIDYLVIIAGGKGERLAPFVGNVPKALVPIGGKPVLQHQLELAAIIGIRKVVIMAGHQAVRIQDFVGDGSKYGLSVRTLVEDEPLGNAGALLRRLDLLPEHCLVLYGDVMLAVDLQRMAKYHLERNADLTALVHPNDHPQDSDLLETDADNRVTAIHLCPHPPGQWFNNLVNAGLYVVRREALWPWARAAGNQDFIKNIMSGLVAEGDRVLAYRSSEYTKDMGTLARLQRVEADWQAGKLSLKELGRSRPAIFLDRDGTLNVEKGHLRKPEDLELLPEVAPALRRLRNAGFRLVVLTNQPVIARGEATEAAVAAIHRRLEWELGQLGAYLDAIYVCPHHPDGGFLGERAELKKVCNCRKPATGLFERACRDLPIDVANSWVIGDQTRDIEMAGRSGLRSILLTTGAGIDCERLQCTASHIADNLGSAAAIVLGHADMCS